MSKKCFIFIIILYLLFNTSYLCSIYAQSSANKTLTDTIDETLKILKNPIYKDNIEEQNDVLYEKISDAFDFETLSRIALGFKYRQFSDAQKKDFTACFSKMIFNVYVLKIRGADFNKANVDYLKEESIPSNPSIERVDIYTDIIHDGIKTPVVYRMLKDKKWRIYDLIIEGISMAGNYREQYRAKIKETPDDIIKELKEKIKQ